MPCPAIGSRFNWYYDIRIERLSEHNCIRQRILNWISDTDFCFYKINIVLKQVSCQRVGLLISLIRVVIRWTVIAPSVQRLAMGWTVRGSNPGGGKIFRICSDWPWCHPAVYTVGTVLFPGVKRPGRGLNHPPPSSAKVKERVEP